MESVNFREAYPESVNWHPHVVEALANNFLETGHRFYPEGHIEMLHDVVEGRLTGHEARDIILARYK